MRDACRISNALLDSYYTCACRILIDTYVTVKVINRELCTMTGQRAECSAMTVSVHNLQKIHHSDRAMCRMTSRSVQCPRLVGKAMNL